MGVIDTGVDWLHEDLAENIYINPNEVPGNGEDDDGNAGGGKVDERITEKQAIIINEALEGPGQNRSGFLAHMKAGTVEDILAKDYAKAMQTIKAREQREPGEEG